MPATTTTTEHEEARRLMRETLIAKVEENRRLRAELDYQRQRIDDVTARVDALVTILVGDNPDGQARLFALEEQARDTRAALRGERCESS